MGHYTCKMAGLEMVHINTVAPFKNFRTQLGNGKRNRYTKSVPVFLYLF
jgi:hypothetical protein